MGGAGGDGRGWGRWGGGATDRSTDGRPVCLTFIVPLRSAGSRAGSADGVAVQRGQLAQRLHLRRRGTEDTDQMLNKHG